MIGKFLGGVLIIVILLGLIYLIFSNLNERLDEHMRPTMEKPTFSMKEMVGILVVVALVIGVIATQITETKERMW